MNEKIQKQGTIPGMSVVKGGFVTRPTSEQLTEREKLHLPTTEWENRPVRKLTDRFIVPPFSVLDARKKYWTNRKKWWLSMIPDDATARLPVKGRDIAMNLRDKDGRLHEAGRSDAGSSILDPVLAEVLLLWFCPKGGTTIDPFAGDTAFGFVSAYKGHPFTGIELLQSQVDYNQATVDKFKLPAKYIHDDGQNILSHVSPKSTDFLFSCPPYFDMTVYSNHPCDASNQKTWGRFLIILENALSAAATCLKPNRFAVIVCTELRNNKIGGLYYGFLSAIQKIMINSGFVFYNDAILLQPVETAAMRVPRAMHTRKLVKVHQNVLIFYKGNLKEITRHFPIIE